MDLVNLTVSMNSARLAGKTDDDIRGDGNLRDGCPRHLCQLCEGIGRGFTRHAFQHCLAPGLERQVQVTA